jgi:hypothetical protein
MLLPNLFEAPEPAEYFTRWEKWTNVPSYRSPHKDPIEKTYTLEPTERTK